MYIIWSVSILIMNYVHVFVENYFIVKNSPFLIKKRTFKYLSYFEKIILILFYKKGWFEKSLANLYRKKDIIEHRRNNYPMVYYFHCLSNKVFYDFNQLKNLIKDYKYYKNSEKYDKLSDILRYCFNLHPRYLIKYLILLELYKNKYYNLNGHLYFYKLNDTNFIKLNKVFNIFLLRSNKKLKYFNLDKWYDWYYYNFNKNIIKKFQTKKKLTKQQIKSKKNFKLINFIKWINLIYKYKIRLRKFNDFFNKKLKGVFYFRFNLNNFFKIKINNEFKILLNYYKIKFNESSIAKHINSSNLKLNSIFYIRKNRIFNKGRYSRNRQLYRTGVYWCLWLNIIMVYGLYFIFYRFTFNFGYFWWGIMFLAFSTIFSRISKYNFYNLFYLFSEFYSLVKWYGFIFSNSINFIEKSLIYYFNLITIYNYISIYKNSFNYFLENYYYYFLKNFNIYVNNKKRIKIIYMWQGMKEKDESFLRYKTIIHWLKELYRLIIT